MKNVAVVEDNKNARTVIMLDLEDLGGVTVTGFSSGEDLLEAMKKNQV